MMVNVMFAVRKANKYWSKKCQHKVHNSAQHSQYIRVWKRTNSWNGKWLGKCFLKLECVQRPSGVLFEAGSRDVWLLLPYDKVRHRAAGGGRARLPWSSTYWSFKALVFYLSLCGWESKNWPCLFYFIFFVNFFSTLNLSGLRSLTEAKQHGLSHKNKHA